MRSHLPRLFHFETSWTLLALVQNRELNQLQMCTKWNGEKKIHLNNSYQNIMFKIKSRTVLLSPNQTGYPRTPVGLQAQLPSK